MVGNGETAPASADASIAVQRTLLPVLKARTFTDSDGDTYTIKLTGPGTLNAVQFDPAATGRGPIDYLLADGTTTKSSILVTVIKNKAGGDGIVTIGDVIGAGALGLFTATASNLVMNGVDFAGSVRSIKVRDILNVDVDLASSALRVGGTAADKLSIAAGHISNGTLIQTPGIISSLTAGSIDTATVVASALGQIKTKSGGEMNVDLQVTGAVGSILSNLSAAGNWNATSFGPVTVANGTLFSNMTTVGSVARITVKSGGILGLLTADHFGAISVTGGNFSGQLASTTPAAALGKTLALTSLKVAGGDFTGTVRLLGRAGPITVTASRLGVGGNLLGATVNANAIGSVTIGRNFADSIVLGGADLGADHAFGGGDDVFNSGTIGAIKIGGDVTGTRSLIGAGFSRIGSGDSIVGGTASAITRLTVTGSADSSLHFAAGLFKNTPKIGGAIIDPTTDPRFLIA